MVGIYKPNVSVSLAYGIELNDNFIVFIITSKKASTFLDIIIVCQCF